MSPELYPSKKSFFVGVENIYLASFESEKEWVVLIKGFKYCTLYEAKCSVSGGG